jgi:hypothetical protein
LKLCSRTLVVKDCPFPIPSWLGSWVARHCDVSFGGKIQNKNARINGTPLCLCITLFLNHCNELLTYVRKQPAFQQWMSVLNSWYSSLISDKTEKKDQQHS